MIFTKNRKSKQLQTNQQRFVLANAMLLAYFFTLGLGIAVAMIIGRFYVDVAGTNVLTALFRWGPFYDIPVVALEIMIIVAYERPIRQILRLPGGLNSADRRRMATARKRLLNEPYFLMALNMVTWLGAAIYYYLVLNRVAGTHLIRLLLINSLLTAIINVVVTFFVLQSCLQRRLIPYFFPDGRLSRTPGVLRIRIATRLAALISAASLIPMLVIGFSLLVSKWRLADGIEARWLLNYLTGTITAELLLFALTAVFVTYFVVGNLSRPLREIIAVLHQIRRGQLHRRVQVISNDEIGYTGEAINEMAAGLREREKLHRSLLLAREVQQKLLPPSPPAIDQLEISGRSIYCDETGGDYYDYVQIGDSDHGRMAVVIGDVSGHGISSALLMASTRAYLRSRVSLPGIPCEIVGHLNRLVSLDTRDTGQFMTLFYLDIDWRSYTVAWVRAGHEPACLYRPQTDRFQSLSGAGIALGIDSAWHYQQYAQRVRPSDILVMTTDGIFETRNRKEMFGKERFKTVIRRHHQQSSEAIRQAVLKEVINFRGPMAQEDDITLVVVKFR
jgi:sigma-B regulation protein RsbU (phosphoserine phosphatase)